MPNLYKQTWVVWTARNYSCFKLNTRFWNNSQEEWFCQTCHSGLFCGHHCLSSYHFYAGLSALISSLWTYRRPVCWALNSAVFGDRFWLASVRSYGWRCCIFRKLNDSHGCATSAVAIYISIYTVQRWVCHRFLLGCWTPFCFTPSNHV